MKQQNLELGPSYDDRFIEDYLGGKISHDPITAIIELIANSWDAGASVVKIKWPNSDDSIFSIVDNGHGLTDDEFTNIWTILSYNRISYQGSRVDIPDDNDISNEREAYGKNGKGRFAAFLFGGANYFVETKKQNSHVCFKVSKSKGERPFSYEKVELPSTSLLFNKNHGTAVFTEKSINVGVSVQRIRSEIGMRFLTDPNFKVTVNEKEVEFDDLSEEQITKLSFDFNNKKVEIVVIHTSKSDKNTDRHGIAWHANNRLVGKCCWESIDGKNVIDGRTSVAKQYSFIVKSELISDYIKPDWSGFEINEVSQKFNDLAIEKINGYIFEQFEGRRTEVKKKLLNDNRQKLQKIGPIAVNKWNNFIDILQNNCPNLSLDELESIAMILANLEVANSKYGLIHQLGDCKPEDLDELHQILQNWNIISAKRVLDEIQTRLSIVEELRRKIHNPDTLEVQELQPLFGKGLWIFGAEFESIEYTSNEGMTKVLSKLFKCDEVGSRNRPDFVVLEKSTVGLYGRYDYSDNGYETGIKRVVIVELKKPNIHLGSDEKEQCWKYVKELYSKGAILENANVTCYLLGESIKPQESSPRKDKNDSVLIIPLTYDTVLKRAETRMLNLHKKIQQAPFLEEFDADEFVTANRITSYEQISLSLND